MEGEDSLNMDAGLSNSRETNEHSGNEIQNISLDVKKNAGTVRICARYVAVRELSRQSTRRACVIVSTFTTGGKINHVGHVMSIVHQTCVGCVVFGRGKNKRLE